MRRFRFRLRPGSAPHRTVTGRAIVLGALVVLLLVLLAAPLNRYFGSRSDLSNASQQLRQDRAELAQLQAQKKKWSDPGYVQAQARKRLQYAMPGDTVYIVVRRGEKTEIEKAAGPTDSSERTPSSWNVRLWASVRNAGR